MSVASAPKPLQQNTVEARIIKQKVWDRMWRKDEHFMGVIVGREGSGKSHTGIKIAEVADPTFTAERVMFDPVNFLKKLKKWKENNNTQGKMVVIDEAGVGVGVRTWYDKAQVRLNQVLQIIRDENMGVIFTLPRLEELDSQTQGRLHAYIELTDKEQDEWVKMKWLNWDPTRDGRNKIYREYPKLRVNGVQRQIKRLCVSPPSEDIIADYKQRKNEFQAREYEDAIDEMEDDVEDEKSVKEIAMDIVGDDKSLASVVSQHSQNKQAYINKNIIRAEYELSHSDAQAVKSLLDQRFDSEELEEYL
jgi:hypothetical protein